MLCILFLNNTINIIQTIIQLNFECIKSYLCYSFQSPSLSDNTIDTSGHDDASSSGAKDDDDDDDDDDVNDDKIDGQLCGDPEKLKAFNVSMCFLYAAQYFYHCFSVRT